MFSTSIIAILSLLAADAKPTVTIPAVKHQGANASAVALSSDGSKVAAGYGGAWVGRQPLLETSGGVAVWDRKSGKQLYSAKQIGDILRVEFSRDGQYLGYNWIYTPGDGIHAHQTVLVDLRIGKAIGKWESNCFAFSPVNNHLVVGSRGVIEIVEVPSLELVRDVDVTNVRCIVVAADGRSAAALGIGRKGNGRSAHRLSSFRLDEKRIPQIRNGEKLDNAQNLAISTDGTLVVTGHDGGEARVWSIKEAESKPKLLTVDTPLALFPLFLDKGKTLGLITQPANGMTWDYDTADPANFKIEQGKSPSWADLYKYDLSVDSPKVVHWRLEDASYPTIYARFRTTRGHPEVNSRRYAVSADGKTFVAGCNGCSLINLKTGKIERIFTRDM